MKKSIIYVCSSCGNETKAWLGRCNICGEYSTLEKIEEKAAFKDRSKDIKEDIEQLISINLKKAQRIKTNIEELDRVLTGGIVEGSLNLLGGEPGIGKSTLLMQLCENICNNDKISLYISGEESLYQIKLRSDRLHVKTKNLFVLTETDIDVIERAVIKLKPALIVIDSIQTMCNKTLHQVQGSMVQVRECTLKFMNIAKSLNIAIFIVGHVTKDGTIAGPKTLEHMVDTVLYFEGERDDNYRMIRAVKNRFGSTNEVGMFEMKEQGLAQIKNPSEHLLSGRAYEVSGSCIGSILEGSRAILAELQALVTVTNMAIPRRAVTGIDYNRALMIIAVLEKKYGLRFYNCDVYINLVGGMRSKDPALDVAIAIALISSHKDIKLDNSTLFIGEVGLTGEIRPVQSIAKRVMEAQKMGFNRVYIPKDNVASLCNISRIQIIGLVGISELINTLKANF